MKLPCSSTTCRARPWSDDASGFGSSTTEFHVYHDAAEPVGFSIIHRKHKVVYLLDTVRIDEKHMMEIEDANLVIIDSNYDNLLLSQGKYPYPVKRRIAESGHLSNETTGNVILNHPNPATEFWLGHLSKDNNSSVLASQTVKHILKNGKRRKNRFKILPRKSIGPFWEPPVEQYKLISTVLVEKIYDYVRFCPLKIVTHEVD